jgi:hypothetical protein
MILTGGISLPLAAWALVLLPVAAAPDSIDPGPFSALLLGIAALSAGRPLFTPLVIAAAAAVTVFSGSRICRAAAALAIVLSLLSGSVTALWALTAAAAVSVFLGNRLLRSAVYALSMILGILISGLPGASAPPGHTAVLERHSDSTVHWDYAQSLDASAPGALLRTCGLPGDTLYIVLDAGGIRDTTALGTLSAGQWKLPVTPGRQTYAVPHDGRDPVIMEMTRPWRPFEHPVIHFVNASTSPEEGT